MSHFYANKDFVCICFENIDKTSSSVIYIVVLLPLTNVVQLKRRIVRAQQ